MTRDPARVVTLFDIEPHGTPCLVCDSETCTCRAAGTLAGDLPAPHVYLVTWTDGYLMDIDAADPTHALDIARHLRPGRQQPVTASEIRTR